MYNEMLNFILDWQLDSLSVFTPPLLHVLAWGKDSLRLFIQFQSKVRDPTFAISSEDIFRSYQKLTQSSCHTLFTHAFTSMHVLVFSIPCWNLNDFFQISMNLVNACVNGMWQWGLREEDSLKKVKNSKKKNLSSASFEFAIFGKNDATLDLNLKFLSFHFWHRSSSRTST